MAGPTAEARERSECLLASLGLDCISSAAASSAADGGLARPSPALVEESHSGCSRGKG